VLQLLCLIFGPHYYNLFPVHENFRDCLFSNGKQRKNYQIKRLLIRLDPG
jgi:hypothetical protein